MNFGEDVLALLPGYLADADKQRLKVALNQFFRKEGNNNEIDYSRFYKSFNYNHFLQADLVREIRIGIWNDNDACYNKMYRDAIIISNTCDISNDNGHLVNDKECLMAPIIDLNEFIKNLKEKGYTDDKLKSFLDTIRKQLVSNILYLPKNEVDLKEYIIPLDKIFWFPTIELNSYLKDVNENRIISLDLFGHYLFTLKLSYHLCRLPEEKDR